MTVRLAYNLKLLAQHTAGGAPNLGEGMAMKIKDGRRYMYIAHEHGPAAFSIFDVALLTLVGQPSSGKHAPGRQTEQPSKLRGI